MSVQIRTEEVEGCRSYFKWLCDRVRGEEISTELCRFLFMTDFTYRGQEDELRAMDAVDMRKYYAKDIGGESGKNERDVDRIRKSVTGKCSVMELLVRICEILDGMINQDDSEGSMMPDFFRILIHNLGLDIHDDEDFDHHQEAVTADWAAKTERFMERKYDGLGHGGGLFPLEKEPEIGEKDQRKGRSGTR